MATEEELAEFEAKYSFYALLNLWQAKRLLAHYAVVPTNLPAIRHAILFGFVTYYFRALESIRSRRLARTGSIRQSQVIGFDRDTHNTLLKFRNKAVAHHDVDVHEFSIYFPYLEQKKRETGASGRGPMHPILSTSVLYSISDSGFLEKAQGHIESLLTHVLERLATSALKWYALCWKAGRPTDAGDAQVFASGSPPSVMIPPGGALSFDVKFDPATFGSGPPKLDTASVCFEVLDFRAYVFVETGVAKVRVEEFLRPDQATTPGPEVSHPLGLSNESQAP